MIKKKVFVFDTETTGLLNDSMSLARIFHGAYDALNEPYMLSISYSIMELKYSKHNDLVGIKDVLIGEADTVLNWEVDIPQHITDINKLTKEICSDTGVNPLQAIHTIMQDVATADILVCHNTNYDVRILANAIQMLKTIHKDNQKLVDVCQGWLYELYSKEVICTAYMSMMLLSNKVGKNYGSTVTTFKRKSLKKLHIELCGYEFENAHNATADTLALYRVFKILARRYNHVLKMHTNSEKILSEFTIDQLRQYKKDIESADKYSLPAINSPQREMFAMILLNSQRNTLKAISRAHVLQGTLFGSSILS